MIWLVDHEATVITYLINIYSSIISMFHVEFTGFEVKVRLHLVDRNGIAVHLFCWALLEHLQWTLYFKNFTKFW
jgi:hypothetical protein